MKEYRLAGWPDLGPVYQRTAYRRMLSDMSQRHVTLSQLVGASGLRRNEVREFVDMLHARGLVEERRRRATESLFGSLHPLGNWLRRLMQLSPRRDR
mgnify:CR=1 FL=1